jgi:hypothetical protein
MPKDSDKSRLLTPLPRPPDIQLLPDGDILVPVKERGQWRMVRVRPADEEYAFWLSAVQWRSRPGLIRRAWRACVGAGTGTAAVGALPSDAARHAPKAAQADESAAPASGFDQAALLSASRALDIHAAAVFQVGVAVFVGAVAVGAQATGRLAGAIIAGGALLLFIGCYAALVMVPEAAPPTPATVDEKRLQVQKMMVIFVLSLVTVTVLIFLTFDLKSMVH